MKEKNVKTKTPNKKALGLTTKIFIALLAVRSWVLYSAIWFQTAALRKM